MLRHIRLYHVFALAVCAFPSALPAGDGNSVLALPWEGAPFSADPKGLYQAASAVAPATGIDAIVLMDEERYVFDAEGRAVHTQYLVYKVLTQQGAEDWADISLNWEPWHEERPSITARVITPDYVAHALDMKTVTDAPAQEEDSTIYSDRRVVRAPLPAIAPGSVIEEQEISKESAPLFGAGTVNRAFFGRVVPVQHARLILDAPASLPLRYELRLLPEMKPQRSENNGSVEIVFDAGPMDPLEAVEENLPSDVAAYPEIVFSTGSSWQKMAEEYSGIVDQRIATADAKALGALVAKLVAGKKTRDEKAAAIVRYLNREVRYTGVEFGDAAIVPRSPAETLKQKYGDCKDKASLLVALLRAADIPASVALLNAGDREDAPANLPGMGIFDHAIVYVPGSPALWIDATDDYARPGELPTGDQGRLALVAAPGSTALVQTPVSLSQENALVERREFHLAENGPAQVIEISEPHGSLESEYRGYYADKENKDRKNGLTDYVKSQYLADKLDSLTRSDPDDISTQFQLRLESNKARRGFTDLDGAVAAIRLDTLFSRLPKALQNRERDDDKDKDSSDAKPKRPRTSDYQLEEAFVTEWRYTIFPPPGFLVKPLPKNETLPAGPAVLTQEFSAESSGVVHATIRFDTGKRRMTVAEAMDLRNHVDQWRQGQPIMIYFEPAAQRLLKEGKVREAMQAYRDLIALHPKEAIHHLQIAQALLSAGLGDAARQQARIAVKLEPNSALAQKTLADILEHDAVGRKFRKGADFTGAEAAFRVARKLDPDDNTILGNMAILLEHDSDGERYGPGARLKEAIAEYRRLQPEQLAEIGMQNYLPYALVYAGEFSEAKKYSESLNSPPVAVIVAAEAAMNGSQAAIIEAGKRIGDEGERKETFKAAGQILMQLRKYALAADLVEAGASGDTTSKSAALAALLRKAQLHESFRVPDGPAGVVMQLLLATFEGKISEEMLEKLASRNARVVLKDTEQDEINQSLKIGRQLRGTFLRSGLPADALLDITLELIDLKVEGDDASGYRVSLRVPNTKNTTEYVVKEDGQYKILDDSEKPNAIGLEILDRLAAKNIAGARALLDWLREEQHLAGGDDPLAGPAFPRFWTKGKEASVDQMRLAAAAILVQTKPTAAQGISILEAAREKASDDATKLNISLALLAGYQSRQQYDKVLEIASGLAKQYPESRTAFLMQNFALRALGKYQEADQLAQARLQNAPEDIDALRALIHNAAAREDYVRAHELSQKVLDIGKAEASDFNDLAWTSLFTGEVKDSDVESALKATQLSQNDSSLLHTLGCVYAEIGKIKEAREVLIQAMDLLNLDEPDANYWYAFGRIAEQYGEREAALANYRRVEKPKNALQIPESSYRLAQNRLRVLEGVSGPATARSALSPRAF